jgi:hypothetical protein
MLSRLIAPAVVLSVIAAPAVAGPAEDASFISEISYSDAVIDTTFETLGPIIRDSIAHQLGTQGISISDPDRYFDIFIEEFRLQFAAKIRRDFVPVLQDSFSDEELADIAAFFRSPTGQRYAAQTPDLMRAGSRIGELAGASAGLEAAPRIAERLGTEGITITDSNGATLNALKWLRGY